MYIFDNKLLRKTIRQGSVVVILAVVAGFILCMAGIAFTEGNQPAGLLYGALSGILMAVALVCTTRILDSVDTLRVLRPSKATQVLRLLDTNIKLSTAYLYLGNAPKRGADAKEMAELKTEVRTLLAHMVSFTIDLYPTIKYKVSIVDKETTKL